VEKYKRDINYGKEMLGVEKRVNIIADSINVKKLKGCFNWHRVFN
jgi:hypothetical protein